MKYTAGIYILDRNCNLLIGKPTGASSDENTWSIPKGLVDPGETYIQAAVRETREEAGLLINPDKLIELDEIVYPHGKKTLKAFIFHSELFCHKIDQPYCESMFTAKDGKKYPEISHFLWVSLNSANKWIHLAQVEGLIQVNKYLRELESSK